MYNLTRLSNKKLTIRINIVTVTFIIVIIMVIYSLLLKQCRLSSDSSNNSQLKKQKYRLLILILTAPDNMKERVTLRKTWLSDKSDNVKHLFVIGTENLQLENHETLQSEQLKFKDLLLLPKLRDAYGTLTKKVLQSFKRIIDEYDFDYLLKVDDDSFVLIHKLLVNLDTWEAKGYRKELYWGFFNGKAQVKRHGAWKESEWNLCDYYLPYAVGGGYVLSYNLVKYIAMNADNLRLFNSEDVSVGLWLSAVANIERRHDIRFDTEYRSRGCSNDYLITHKQSPDSMKALHDYYTATGNLCSKEFSNRMSYHYNWTVPPSQCCVRKPGII
ncbi:beta-1,3-galactosyltransferase 6 [Microplitis demolitor]|uniref:beta-1,3-galactosyltransferase 6 n=1 Tax=Microplitis demolitor TaxID=69319 RepID=UPI0004CC9240|nr:beta-1,3-galactosyltransferase 6 [Microplitis demolitor]